MEGDYMKSIGRWLAGAGLVAAVQLFSPASAQSNYAPLMPYQENAKRIKAAEMVAPLKSDLFGESVSLYNGSTEFTATDIDIPGNSAIPVRLSRKLKVESLANDSQILGGFGQWSLDVPYISGTFLETDPWMGSGNGRRCSEFSVPRRRDQMEPWDFYSGTRLNIPGRGEQELLRTGASYQPTVNSPIARLPMPAADGQVYPVGTRDFDRVRCLATTANGFPGEGFVVRDASGLTYTFDMGFTRRAGLIEKPTYSVEQPGHTQKEWRVTIYLAVSKIEDRFGNWVHYHWQGDKLTAITANDGRAIGLSWNGANISAASAHGRNWLYSYNGGVMNVALPDGSSWRSEVAGAMTMFYPFDGGFEPTGPGCDEPMEALREPHVQMPRVILKHPSGATGTFGFSIIRHRRSGIPASACQIVWSWHGSNVYAMAIPRYFDVYSLGTKNITGPGLAPRQWTYQYDVVANDPHCGNDCQDVKSVWVNDPDGAVTEHRFGAFWQRNDGRLLGTYRRAADGTVKRSEVHTYMTDAQAASQPFPDIYGAQTSGDDGVAFRVRPIVATTIAQDGNVPGPVYWTPSSNPPPPPGCQPPACEPPPPVCDPSTGACEGPMVFAGISPTAASPAPPQSSVLFNTQRTHSVALSTQSTGAGATFHRSNETFDQFARPAVVSKWSSLGYAKTDVTAYHDDPSNWVLGQVKRETNANTNVVMSQVDFNAKAQPWKVYRFGKLQHTLGYHVADGTLASVVDGRNQGTILNNWHRGVPRLIRHADGNSQSASVNDAGWITSLVNEVGAATGYGYDAMGRIAAIVHPLEDGKKRWNDETIEFFRSTESFHGLPIGSWVRRHHLGGGGYRNTYLDGFWRPVLEETFDIGNVEGSLSQVIKKYDDSDRLQFQSYPIRGAGAVSDSYLGTHTTYDALDRPTRVEQDSEYGRLSTTTEYLSALQTRVTNPRGRATVTQFQAFDQPAYDAPTGVTTPENAATEIYRHPQLGHVTRLKRRSGDGNLHVSRHYVYDGYMQLCKTIEPETGVAVTTYDAAGNINWTATGQQGLNAGTCGDIESVPTNQRVTRTYDVRNRITALNFPDGNGSQTWRYTADGLPESVTTQNGGAPVTNSYTYNRRRLPVSETQAHDLYSWPVTYDYNANGHQTKLVYPAGLTVDYIVNALGQVSSVKSPSQYYPATGTTTPAQTYANGVAYYPNGAIQQFTYGNGIVHTMSQNVRGLPVRSRDTYNGFQTPLDDSYDYDANGNVLAISDGRSGARGNRSMTYDGLDRLLTTTSPMFGGTTARYTYDALDNLTRVVAPGRDHTYGYDTASNRLTNVMNTAGGATVRGLGYDPRGNLSNDSGQAYVFDMGNRLRSAKNGLETYRYDGHGRRALQDKPSGAGAGKLFSLYAQDGKLLWQRDERNGKRLQHIYLGGSLIAQRSRPMGGDTETITYQHTDALGSPVAVTNTARAEVERSEYEPFGKLLNRPVKDQIGYTGHATDAVNGLTYMQQRYYDPGIGRFLSVDPVTALDGGQERHFNRYWYASSNPYKFVDPDGRWVQAVYGAIAGGTGGYVSSGNSFREKAVGMVTGALAGAAVGFVAPQTSHLAGMAAAGAVASMAGQASGSVSNAALDKGVANVSISDVKVDATTTALGALGAGVGGQVGRGVSYMTMRPVIGQTLEKSGAPTVGGMVAGAVVEGAIVGGAEKAAPAVKKAGATAVDNVRKVAR